MAMMLEANDGEIESLAELSPGLMETERFVDLTSVLAVKEFLIELPPVLTRKEPLAELAVKDSLAELPPGLTETEPLLDLTSVLAVKEFLIELPPAQSVKEFLIELPPALAKKKPLAELLPALVKKSLAKLPPALAEKPVGLPPGKYVMVGWDMDTTGRRLIDEICQISAYTPKQSYSQYIMPYGDLNPGARRRHHVRVVTVGPYRMLKDTNTRTILKTKSEVSALSNFLDWLEKEKGDGSVILIYHDPRRLNPTMLLEALAKYKLLDRFKSIVAGFADSYALAAGKNKVTANSVSLKVLARVLLNTDTLAVDTALERASASYRIVEHLAQGEHGAGGECANPSKDMVDTARTWSRPVHTELETLSSLKKLLERQNTFRPVFAPLLRSTRAERKRVTQLRRLLIDAGLLYNQMRDAWQDTKLAGIEKQLAALSVSAKKEDIKELLEIFNSHFDPAQRQAPRNGAQAPSSAGGTNEAEDVAAVDAGHEVTVSEAVAHGGEVASKHYHNKKA